VRRLLAPSKARYGQDASGDWDSPGQIDTVGHPNEPRTMIVRGDAHCLAASRTRERASR